MTTSTFEATLSSLPFDVLCRFLQAMDVVDVCRLARVARYLYTIILTDNVFWRHAYIEDFLGGDHAGIGEGVDEREEVWLEQMLAIPSHLDVYQNTRPELIAQYSGTVSLWFILYQRRARVEHRWKNGQFRTHSFDVPAPTDISGRTNDYPPRIFPFQSPFGSVLIKWDKLFWVNGTPWPCALELCCDESQESPNPPPLSPSALPFFDTIQENSLGDEEYSDSDSYTDDEDYTNDGFSNDGGPVVVIHSAGSDTGEETGVEEVEYNNDNDNGCWAATCVQQAATFTDNFDYPDWQILVWHIPSRRIVQSMARHNCALSPYLNIPLGPKSSRVSVRGSWLLSEHPTQPKTCMMAVHLPTKTISTVPIPLPQSASLLVSEIQTYSNQSRLWCKTNRSAEMMQQPTSPSVAIFSAALAGGADGSAVGIYWSLVQHTLPTNTSNTEVMPRTESTGMITPTPLGMVRRVSLHRVDHTRMLVVFGSVDQYVVLIRSLARDDDVVAEPTNAAETIPVSTTTIDDITSQMTYPSTHQRWMTKFALKTLHTCARLDLLVVVLHSDDLLTVSLDTGATLRRIAGEGPAFISPISARFMLCMAPGVTDGFAGSDGTEGKSARLVDAVSGDTWTIPNLQLASNVGGPTHTDLGCTQTAVVTTSQLCWLDNYFYSRVNQTGLMVSLGQLARSLTNLASKSLTNLSAKSLASLTAKTITIAVADFEDP